MEKPAVRQDTQPDRRVIVFIMAGHEYVCDMTLLQEIIRVEGVAHIDGAPPYVEGVVRRRGRLTPIVDLRKRLGLQIGPPTVETCAIVVNLPVGPVGFLVDRVSELIWVKMSDFEPPSPVITRGSPGLNGAHVQGVAYLDGRALVMLDLERLLTPGEQHPLGGIGEPLERSAEQAQAMRRLLLFELGGELYGIAVTAVAEVRAMLPWMPLPNAPPHIRGLVNLRGSILPVVDLGRQFGFERRPDGPETRLIISKGHAPIAWVVDRVNGIVRLPQEDFQAAPSGVAQIGAEYYEQLARVDGRMLIELNVQALWTDTSIQNGSGKA